MSEPTHLGPLAFPCPHCHVRAGERCRNYRGKGKQPCPDRGKAPPKGEAQPKPKAEQKGLFDEGDDQ
jgi:hypothetical protein